jgi:hypothetical protein
MTNISYIQKTNLRVACAGGVGGTQDVYYPKGNLREIRRASKAKRCNCLSALLSELAEIS